MRGGRIAILNLNPDHSLAAEVRCVLATTWPEASVVHEASIAPTAEDWPQVDLGPVLTREPQVLLVCGRAEGHTACLKVLATLREEATGLPVVMVVAEATATRLSEWLEAGAADFVLSPLHAADLVPRLRRLLPREEAETEAMRRLKLTLSARHILGENPVFLEEMNKIPAIARCDACVLICGETGTGKEVCARAIHYLSARASRPFVTLNAGAIPPELVENELFGHQAGAYTGAGPQAAGVVGDAEGGTLFLDEVDCLPLSAQPKLLRFLQEKEFRPLGARQTRKLNIRILAASNVDLPEAVAAGRFRKDLYFRLNVVPLNLPPLRQRKTDIPLLARHFLAKYAAEHARSALTFTPDAVQALLLHDWPGNVRELENVIERAVVLANGNVLHPHDLGLQPGSESAHVRSMRQLKAEVVEQFERSYISELLVQNHGNIAGASRAARKHRRAFWELMRKYRLTCRPPP